MASPTDPVGQELLEPIAVIGFSLKFPQEATTAQSFWTMLQEKRCAMTEWPRDRLNLDAYHHLDKNRNDTLAMRGAHFIKEDLGVFDAPFFSIPATEAMCMDPQHRILLETTYRALENGKLPNPGIALEKVSGTNTGVYTGAFADDFKLMTLRDVETLPKYAITGEALSLLANRISWFFGLSGPSMNIDTACSSSLVALDVACQGLRNRDSRMALVAGSNLVFGLENMLTMSNMNFFSPSSKCYSFDDRANGYARGEGFGVVVVKLLSDAIKDGDTIRAVIRSTGSNQDGRTPGITQPSSEAQASLIRRTYEKAGLDMKATRFFEAHGTGTAIGDPTEASAIGGVFRKHRSSDDPLYIGAVKSNIGHLEGSSGIAGLIKSVLVLEKGVIPPNTNFRKLNPRIDAEFLNLKFPVVTTPWPTTGLRRVSVNAFGFGGSNSHVVLDDAYHYLSLRGLKASHCTVKEPPTVEELDRPLTRSLESRSPDSAGQADDDDATDGNGINGHGVNGHGVNGHGVNGHGVNGHGVNGHGINDRGVNGHGINGSAVNGNGINDDHLSIKGDRPTDESSDIEDVESVRPKLLVWSTADEKGLARTMKLYNEHFQQLPEPGRDKVHSADFLDNLSYTLALRRSTLPWKSFTIAHSFTELRTQGISFSRPVRSSKKLGIAFVFTGQGAQFSEMGKELLRFDVYKQSLRAFETCLQNLGCNWSLLDELAKPSKISNIDDPAFSQALCTALQVGLIDLLRSFNILPSAVVGHSSGEIAAAYCAGGISFSSACKVAYFRGKLAGELAQRPGRRGAMISVGASESRALQYLKEVKPLCGDITVACINSPTNVTLSGDEDSIDALKLLLEAKDVFVRKLRVGVAYHSPQMDEIAKDYLNAIEPLEAGNGLFGAPIMVSSITGVRVLPAELAESKYWVRNMISPVRFSDALVELASQTGNLKKKVGVPRKTIEPVYTLLEIGPHAALRGPIKSTLELVPRGQEISYESPMIRHSSAIETLLKTIGRLYCLGYKVALEQVNHTGETGSLTSLPDLPEYPFDHSQTYWYESRISEGLRLRKHPRLDLLGTATSDWNPLEARWRKIIRISETPWVEDHQVNDLIIYPAAAMLVMAVEAAKQTADESRKIRGYLLQDVTFHKAVNVPADDPGVELQFYMRPMKDSAEKSFKWSEFRLCTYDDDHWVENCRGTIQVEYEEEETEVDRGNEALQQMQYYKDLFGERAKTCTGVIDPDAMYKHFRAIGMGYGPAFQALENIHFNEEGEAIADVRTFDWSSHDTAHFAQPHVIHPVSLDAAAQLIFLALTGGARKMISTTIPTRVRNLWLAATGLSNPDTKSIKAYTKSSFRGYRETESSLFALDSATGDLRLMISRLETTTVANRDSSSQETSAERPLCYAIERKPDISLLHPLQLLAHCNNNELGAMDRNSFYEDLTLLLFTFIARTLDQLTLQKPEDTKPHLNRYIAWMQLQIEKFHDGHLLHSRPDWITSSTDASLIDSIMSRVGNSSKEGRLFVSVGQNLLDMLHGSMDPLDLLFSGDLVEGYYQDIFNVPCSQKAAMYLNLLSHKNPGMKILEVGAGTGAMTLQLLPSITSFGDNNSRSTRYAQYDYTDISGSYFEKAEQKLSAQSARMNFKVLNIENDPIGQGYEAASYDLVIAGLVLHATQNLETTLKNVRKLLKPGGKLVLFEIFVPEMLRTGFVFGLLPGWWLSTEAYRTWSPCVSEKAWHEILSKTGFSGADCVFQDYEGHSYHEMGIIVSTAIEETPIQIPNPPVTIIIEPDSSAQASLALAVQSYLIKAKDFRCEIIHLDKVLPTSHFLQEHFVIFLLELEKPLLNTLDIDTFGSLQAIFSFTRKLLWVTGAGDQHALPDFGMVNGLARVLQSENSNFVFVTLALEIFNAAENDSTAFAYAESIGNVISATLQQPLLEIETEYYEKDGMLCVDRLVDAGSENREINTMNKPQSKTQEFGRGPPLALTLMSPGLLDSLRFIEDSNRSLPLGPREVEIEVKAVGVNFMDCLTVLGRVNKNTLGGECAGIVSRIGPNCEFRAGDRVCAPILDCFRTFTRSDSQMVLKTPENLCFAEASAIPITGVTAQYALVEVARLQKDESILIHSATGGIGQLAVQLALSIGAEVFATVGSEEKRQFLIDTYGIPHDHILYSRNTSFAQGIMRMTQNRGVDVVLNSLSGDSLIASWECIASFGRFVEIGKKDIHSHAQLPMYPFRKNAAFLAVDLDHMYAERRSKFRDSMAVVMGMIEKQKLRTARPLKVFPVSEVEEAIRYMQSGKHIGKVVVEFSEDALVQTILSSKPMYTFDGKATYVIVGGLGGIGRTVARWMVDRGARHLLLLSRYGPTSEASLALLDDLKSQGVRVEAPACNIANMDALSATLKYCADSGMPPVKGCIQGAMVLKDALFEKMTFEEWSTSLESKVKGTWNLHVLLPPKMDFFVMLSSISGIIGNVGQANYAAGNTYEDALARYRVAQGEKAASLDLGWIQSIGKIAETKALQEGVASTGYLMPISEHDLLALLEHYCDPSLPASSRTCQLVVGLATPAATRASGADIPSFMQRPMYRHMHQMDLLNESVSGMSETAANYATLFASAGSLSEAGEMVAQGLARKLSKALSMPAEDIDTSKPLHAYGVDSLLAVELRNWFAKEMNADVAIFTIMGGSSIAAVSATVASLSKHRHAAWKEHE